MKKATTQACSERGIALIMTLAILVMVTMLVIGFAVSMRVENTASKNYNDLIKARELARAAVDHAVGTIRDATTRNANILNYVTFPGVAYDLDISQAPPGVRKPLYSVNLNSQFDFNADYWVTAKGGEFPGAGNALMDKVGWIYVASDGTVAPTSLNVYPMLTTKSIIGRFAFWVDDEASKVNINTAGQGNVPADLAFNSIPKELDLRTLLDPPLSPYPYPYAADVQNGSVTYPRATYPYTTIEDVKRSNVLITNDYSANRFSITAYSDDTDDLNALGDSRLNITTLTEANDITDIVGLNSAYTRLADNTKLPKLYSANRAFAFKYPISGGFDGLKQIIANIIAYRLNPRTPAELLELPDAGGDPPAYLGLIKAPYVNEVKVTYDATSPGTLTRTVSVELYYPYGADNSSYLTGAGETIVVGGLPVVGTLGTAPAPFTVPGGLTFNSVTPYRTFSFLPESADSTAFTFPLPLLAATVTVNYNRSPKRLDCAQVPLPNLGVVDGVVTSHGAEVNDPCVNENTAEWTPYRNTPGTMGLVNSVFAPGASFSKTVIRGSPMLSVGELGYIHLPPTAASPNSWQHLRLQPQPAAERATKLIPDWAMLDMFTIPNAKTQGRVNINSYINPGLSSPTTPRLVPLKSLISPVVPLGSLQAVSQNIYGTAAGPTYVNPPDDFGVVGAFDSIGEVCEVLGIDNAGADEAAKEELVRRIAHLITVRSNTFTIWVIAQSIKEPPVAIGQILGTFQANTDPITGEVRAQVVLERYENPVGSGPKFRVRYFRYL